jgi:Mitochondrial resolvase Ydc2 / RNA splicing MRS1
MKIISFDIGIKNMAYCIFDVSQTPFIISDWKVANLIPEDEKVESFFCTCNSTKKPKKGQQLKPCGKKAKYRTPSHNEKQTQYLCDKHAKSQEEYKIPESKFSEKVLKATKLDDLIERWTQIIPVEINRPKKRADIITFITDYLKVRSLCPIVYKKEKSANDIDLVTIGKSIRTYFDAVIENHRDIGLVLIENQISPIANRMKTIQGLLAQYFIMRYDTIDIRMISSANKLKWFHKESSKEEEKTDGQKYKEHKKDGVIYCKQLFEKYKIDVRWLSALDTKKKDDLADCFLQGVWFLQKEGFLTS